jgi:hypothetical protein
MYNNLRLGLDSSGSGLKLGHSQDLVTQIRCQIFFGESRKNNVRADGKKSVADGKTFRSDFPAKLGSGGPRKILPQYSRAWSAEFSKAAGLAAEIF